MAGGALNREVQLALCVKRREIENRNHSASLNTEAQVVLCVKRREIKKTQSQCKS